MGKRYDAIDDRLTSFIESQRLFFVATAPGTGGHVNCSPKGLDSFAILGPTEVAYLDLVGSGLFEAASIASRFRATPKWEIEARQTFALLGDGTLNNQIVLRRFSHDFLLELSFGQRTGEGGSNVGISLAPLIAWKPGRLGRFGL